MSPRILAVEHEDSCPPGLVGTWLAEAGCTLEVCRPWAGDALPALTAYDAVVVLGGEAGAHDDDLAPWLPALRPALRDAVAAGTPVLGICLGHQLLAAALGGTVERNPRGQTLGLRAVGWTDEAADDVWVGGRTHGERAVHWNNDVVATLPPGATVLARSTDGAVQVARFAPRAWGIQAHPEVDASILARWVGTDEADAGDEREVTASTVLDRQAVVDEVAAARVELEAQWRPLVHRFAELVVAR